MTGQFHQTSEQFSKKCRVHWGRRPDNSRCADYAGQQPPSGEQGASLSTSAFPNSGGVPVAPGWGRAGPHVRLGLRSVGKPTEVGPGTGGGPRGWARPAGEPRCHSAFTAESAPRGTDLTGQGLCGDGDLGEGHMVLRKYPVETLLALDTHNGRWQLQEQHVRVPSRCKRQAEVPQATPLNRCAGCSQWFQGLWCGGRAAAWPLGGAGRDDAHTVPCAS